MPTETVLAIHRDELAQIVQSVFETMINLAVDECGLPWFPGADRLTASVHLAGEWEGAVLLECDRTQACSFASRFLSGEPPQVVDDVVRDVLGELANMIGGNLKCVLMQGITLSMPSVVDGSDYSVRVCHSRVHEKLSFQCSEGVFWITILTTTSKPQFIRLA